jgi:hypothetical protein
MATVKPLIRYSDTGKVEEIRSGDTLPSSGGTARPSFAFFMA